MIEPTTAVLVLTGLVFLLVGATLSSYAVGGLGVLVGGTGGYLVGPSLAPTLGVEPILATAGVALVGAIVGAILTYAVLNLAVAAIAFVIGTYVGWSALAGMLVDGPAILEIPVAIGIGIGLAVLAMVLTKTVLVILTAFVGAALASLTVTYADVVAAAEQAHPGPILFDVTAPLFLGLLAFGILVQFGLIRLGWAGRLLHTVPGIRPVRRRGSEQ